MEIAKKIQTEGFKSSPVGRTGAGVYFWRYFTNDEYAKYLAREWWKYSKNKGDYNKVGGDTSLCIISVKIDDNSHFIDFSHGLLREMIRDLILNKIEEIKSRSDKMPSEEEIISSLYTTFVKKIESEEKLAFDAIITNVPPPKGATGSVGKYMGSCAEVIVVRNLDIIKIVNMEAT